MTPSGYSVKPSNGPRMLILDQTTAVDRAVQRHGVVTGLYSIAQIIQFLEESDEDIGESINILSGVPT